MIKTQRSKDCCLCFLGIIKLTNILRAIVSYIKVLVKGMLNSQLPKPMPGYASFSSWLEEGHNEAVSPISSHDTGIQPPLFLSQLLGGMGLWAEGGTRRAISALSETGHCWSRTASAASHTRKGKILTVQFM